MQAEALHSAVAQLSNSLHTFDDADQEGVKPVIKEILEKRETWKMVRRKIAHFEQTGKLPEEAPAKTKSYEGTAAEMKVQLTNCQSRIRKLRHKINNQPGHHLVPDWTQQLAELEAIEKSTKIQILELQYA